MPIRILDAATVGRIAAGEVVERPASVAKELIENALDAGSTSITVEIKEGGIDYLRVTDNGCGIAPGQVRLAFENHATSKIVRAEELDDIRTLGFRGEALPSIAAVSKVEMTTRARGEDVGTRLNVEGGQGLRVQEAGCPEGTTLVMRELFFNVPVRRAFLKKPAYEGSLVADVVARMILGNPGISIRLISNGKTVYHSFGDGKLKHAVFAVYGRETAERMTELDSSLGGMRIFGMIGVGDDAKPTRAGESFFINGRSVRCQLLTQALELVCRERVTIGLYPMCVLNLVLPPASVDVNVHPNKLEVRFRDEAATRAAVDSMLASAFVGERMLDLARETAPVEPAVTEKRVEFIPPAPVVEDKKPAPAPTSAVEEKKPAPAAPVAQPPKARTFAEALAEERARIGGMAKPGVLNESRLPFISREKPEIPTAGEQLAAELPKTEPVRQTAAPEQTAVSGRDEDAGIDYRIIGVYLKTYILVEANESLLMIDQHAAHERIRYERYMQQLREGAASQTLLTPIVLHLSLREMAILLDNIDVLADAGYEVEVFGQSDIQVRAVPFVLGKAELRPLFMDLIGALDKLKAATLDARRGEIMQMSCKGAVKGGDPLSDSEVRTLVAEMLRTGSPPTCPHGRPVVRSFSRRDIEKLFKRIQ